MILRKIRVLFLGCMVPLAGCFFHPEGLGTDTEGTSGVFCAGPILDGFIGYPYSYEVMPSNGKAPYSGWTDNGTLPPGTSIDAATGVISGTPTTIGSFAVQLSATGADSTVLEIDCGVLEVRDPVAIDYEALLMMAPKGCISYGVTISSLLANGVILPVKNAKDALTCALENGSGNGNRDFDSDGESEFPPGITVDPVTCELTGVIDPSLRYGIYAWVVTINQGGSKAYLPYCAPQNEQPGTAYSIKREDADELATFTPGIAILPAEAEALYTYGTAEPDPLATITYSESCDSACYYAYVFSHSASAQAIISTNPSSKFPMSGFEGFTHAIRIVENDAEFLNENRHRAFVVNVSFDYCIAMNDTACGNNVVDAQIRRELIRQNGGGSNYEFSLIVLPED